MSKFVYADGGRDIPPAARPSVVNRKSGSVVSAAPKAPAPRLGTPSTTGNIRGHSQQRPVSPVKTVSYAPAKSNCAQSLPVSRMNSGLGTVPILGPAPVIQKRRSIPSADAARQTPVGGGHSRHGSVTTTTQAQPATVTRFMPSAIPSQPLSIPLTPTDRSSLGPPTPGLPSPLPAACGGSCASFQVAEDSTATDQAVTDEDTTALADLDSPAKVSSQEQGLADLVTTARRERKVQDLEITNASLEAINRTLERQLRKQTAELRRYKRMSRASRMSLNSADPHESRGGRVASDGSMAGGALARAGLSLEDLSEEEVSDLEADETSEMAAEMEDEDEFSHSPSESEEMSPGARALRDAKLKRRDEQRLRLDLSKHQQLLVDSQKMNQSLRRCLGWTEELIKEGRRALAYKVHVSEVELGGRVLSPEEIEARDQEDETLPAEDEEEMGMVHHAARLNPEAVVKQELWDKGSQDRDSGVDLPADGS
ncbi:hypothetical protein DL546_003652 [Coniochaeta pulveracea]|uniref:Uncharacterized protein n=1 Tax=Coniochaeta pulveracea TaxID=177199 RepID=A0A420Y056_9PEZI|nr:hypothetical protein DL546_003652 [Coniochaeta pulveracea]